MGRGGFPNGRTRLAWACGSAALLTGALLATAPGSSAGPTSEEVVLLISTTDVGQTRYSVPGSIGSIHVVTVGAQGGAADCGCISPDNSLPGRGARVEGDLSVDGGSRIFLNVGGVGGSPSINDGGFNGGGDGAQGTSGTGFGGGGGGGASDVRTISRSNFGTLDSRLIVAAGGGGAGADGFSCMGNPSPTGGAGGDAGIAGATSGGGVAEARGGGGGAGSENQGGAAGAAGTGGLQGNADPGIAGSQGLGGDGGASPANDPAGAGGGGAGGLFGGGGGGGGTNASTCPIAGGGGGGGGSSFVPPGGSLSVPDPVVPAEITITASTPRTEITQAPPKIVKTRGKRKAVSIEFESPSGATDFECSVDGREYKLCTSPLEKKFKLGKHVVRVRAVNLIGNADQTPAKAKFEVKKK